MKFFLGDQEINDCLSKLILCNEFVTEAIKSSYICNQCPMFEPPSPLQLYQP